MSEYFVAWGDGSLMHKGKKITQFATEELRIVPEYTTSKTQKILFFGNYMLLLSDKGEVIRKKEGVKESENLKFQHSNIIKKMKKGENHILFLDEKGNIHSLGNNYYGQLGINNNMITYQNNPICINYFYKNNILIEQIHCNKNTSFAIDRNNKLYAWGNSEFIPNYNGNIYSPKQIFLKYSVFSISHNENKMSIKFTELSQDDIERIKNIEKEIKKKNSKILKNMMIKGKSFDDEEKEEEIEEEDLSKDEDKIEEKLGNPFLELNNSLNEIFKLFETKKLDETFDDKIKQAKNYLDKQSTYIMLDNTHPEINDCKDLLNDFYDREIFTDKKDSLRKSIQSKKKNNEETNNWFNYPYDDNQFDEKYKKFKNNIENELNKPESTTEYNKKITEEYDKLLPLTFKLKQLQRVFYKIGLNKIMLKTYEFENVKEALKDIYSKNINSIGKNKIILTKYDLIKSILKNFDDQSKKLGTYYNKLINNKNSDLNEHFLYKQIIESSLIMRTLIEKTLDIFKKENELREEIDLMLSKLDIYKEIYNLQIFLQKIDFSFILKYEEEISNKDKIQKTLNDCSQIDGTINRLMLIKNYLLDPHYPIQEKVVREICLIYLWSVLETAFLKKAIWELLINIYGQENNQTDK
jgi:hypothetical protein